MVIRAIKTIAESLTEIEDRDIGMPYFGDAQHYKPLPLEKENVQPVEPILGDGPTMTFIDGGNGPIFETPSFSIHFLRAAACTFSDPMASDRDMVVREYLSVARTVRTADGYVFRGDVFNTDGTVASISSVTANPESAFMGKFSIEISALGGIMRRAVELDLAVETASRLTDGAVMVMDGTLQAVYPGEREAISRLVEVCAERGVKLTALAKTSRLLTTTGYPLPLAVARIGASVSNGTWYYHPVVENRNPDHPADILFAKLHESSERCYRLEIAPATVGGEEYPSIVGALAGNSRDVSFPGYPYGLIVVDRTARLSEAERGEMIAIARTSLSGGGLLDFVSRHMSAVDSHDILNMI